MDDFIKNFLSKEKMELMKNIESQEKDADKFIIMKEYNDNIDKIIDAYQLLKKFNILLIDTILEDDAFKSALILEKHLKMV